MVLEFGKDPAKRNFFVEIPQGRRPQPTTPAARKRIRQLRQEGRTLGEIVRRLADEGRPLSPAHVSRLMRADGFVGLRGPHAPTPPGGKSPKTVPKSRLWPTLPLGR